MSVRQRQSYLRAYEAPIAENAATPNPGVEGALVWSTVVGDWLRWNGSTWSSVRVAVYVLDSSTNTAFATFAWGDWFWRYHVRVDGRIDWGPGTGYSDTALYRASADRLRTDDRFTIITDLASHALDVQNPNAAGDGIDIQAHIGRYLLTACATGETVGRRFRIETTGKHEWGDGAAAPDVNLYRAATDVLRTDDALRVGGFATGSLPAAATAGAGALAYDTTQATPVVSNGSAWSPIHASPYASLAKLGVD